MIFCEVSKCKNNIDGKCYLGNTEFKKGMLFSVTKSIKCKNFALGEKETRGVEIFRDKWHHE